MSKIIAKPGEAIYEIARTIWMTRIDARRAPKSFDRMRSAIRQRYLCDAAEIVRDLEKAGYEITKKGNE